MLLKRSGICPWFAAAVMLSLCAAAPFQAGGQPGGTTAPAASTGTQPTTGATPPANTTPTQDASSREGELPESLFDRVDKNHDKSITESELKATEAAPYVEQLKRADQNKDGRITREEFDRARQPPFHRDPRTAAALALVLAFAAFCLFLDGFLEPDRRDYFWLSIGGCVAATGVAYLFVASWFLNESPYLAYIAAVPLVLLVIAWLAGATREIEVEVTDPTKQVRYKVGSAAPGARGATGTAKATPAAGAATKPAGTAAPRRPAPPPRTPRPAPLPRPPVPERRPQPPPRPQPPRPPGAGPPPGGTKPPPGGTKPPPGKS
jgi:hypothetical protein